MDNSFLKLSVRELKALMIILKKDGDLSDHELLTSLKNYQEVNKQPALRGHGAVPAAR